MDSGNMSYTSQNGLMLNKSMTEIIICPEGKAGTIVIPNGVTSIGSRVFYNCNNVTDIEIPESIKKIEDISFPGCSSLENIDVDENNTVYFSQEGALYETGKYGTVSMVKCPEKKVGKITISEKTDSISDLAFYGCAFLTDIVIPNEVETIGDKVFDGCSGLTRITIPKSVREIGSEESDTPLFDGCSNLESINVESGGSVYASEDGMLYAKFTEGSGFSTYLVRCPEGKAGQIKISESVEFDLNYAYNKYEIYEISSIKAGAFSNCTKLTSIQISTEIGFINSKAFFNCNALSSVIIPEQVEFISEDAFTGCNSDLNLMVVKESYAETYAKENNLKYKYIEGFVYKEEENDTLSITLYSGNDVDIVIPSEIEGKRVAGVGAYAFRGCDKLESVIFSEGITKIGGHVFEDCSNLDSIKIPKSVVDIEENAFFGCSDLLVLVVEKGSYAETYAQENNINYTCQDNNPTQKDYNYIQSENGTITINKYIGSEPDVTIPSQIDGKKVTSIGFSAFMDNQNLKSVTIPDSITEIGGYAFNNCGSLEQVELSDGLGSIGVYAFWGCNSLKNITIPNSLNDVKGGAFANCKSLETITIDPENEKFSFEDGILYNGEKTKIIQCIAAKEGNFTVPQTVTAIDEYTFSGCSGLTEILADSRNTAYTSQDGILYDKNMEKLLRCPQGKTGVAVLPEGVKYIEWNAFEDCAGLEQIQIPKSVTEIGGKTFFGCSGNLTLIVQKGSYAETYAKELEIKYTYVKEQEYVISASCQAGGSITPKGDVAAPEGSAQKFTIVPDEGYSISDVKIDGKSVGAVSEYTFEAVSASHAIEALFTKNNSIKIEKIQLSQPEAVLEKGFTLQLETEITPKEAENKQLKWNSSNPAAASVENGLVTAVGTGTAMITAESQDGSGVKAECRITVTKPSQQFTGTQSYTKTYGDAGFELDAKLTEGDGEISYSSSDPKIVEVSASGHVTICKAGTAKITISAAETDNYQKCEYHVTVNIAKAKQRIQGTGSYQKKTSDKVFRLDAELAAGDGRLNYTSNNPGVAVVSADGTVTIKSAGNTVIKILAAETDNYQPSEFSVTIQIVEDAPAKLPAPGTTITDHKVKAVFTVAKQGKSVVFKKPASKKITKAVIPASVQLSGVTYQVTGISANAFNGCSKLKSVTIGRNVTSIGAKAFYKCKKLGKITIPSKVEKIGKQAFSGCGRLKSMTVKTSRLKPKSIGAKAFQGINAKAAIKVPKKKKAAYAKIFKEKGAGKKVKIK